MERCRPPLTIRLMDCTAKGEHKQISRADRRNDFVQLLPGGGELLEKADGMGAGGGHRRTGQLQSERFTKRDDTAELVQARVGQQSATRFG